MNVGAASSREPKRSGLEGPPTDSPVIAAAAQMMGGGLWVQDSVASGCCGPQSDWCLDKVPLHEINADIPQPVEVFLVFNLFGDNSESHCSCQLDHCCDHFLIHKVGLQVARVCTVDLQIVDRQVFQARERTEPAAEIIQREFTPYAMQDFDKPLRVLNIRENCSLRDFEANRRRCHPGTIECVDDEAKKCFVA